MSEYNLKFHEALARAVEDGVEIQRTDYNGEDGNVYRFHEGCFHVLNADKNYIPASCLIGEHYERKWRVVEKPKHLEAQPVLWVEVQLPNRSTSTIIPVSETEPEMLRTWLIQFKGKKTKITIDEIL